MKERKVALTFDDGPSPTTDKLLRTLANYQVPATFFVVGRNIPKYEDSLREMIGQGHMIGNHTYSHSPIYRKKPLTNDIGLDTKLIKRASGFTPCLFRPPYGLIKGPIAKVSYKKGMTIIMWNVDAADYTRPGSDIIASRTISAVRPGSIVLLHDLPQSVAAVPKIVKTLKKRHYEFVTVNQLLGSRLTYDAQ